jgi:CheY-like chemotaxis protein
MSTPSCAAVLVVEDDEGIRRRVVEVLQSEGFQTYEADDGKRALAMLPTLPRPVLVLADQLIPTLSEPWFLSSLGEGDRVATLPVVGVASRDAKAPDGYRHVKRPVDSKDLVRIVGEWCVRRT